MKKKLLTISILTTAFMLSLAVMVSAVEKNPLKFISEAKGTTVTYIKHGKAPANLYYQKVSVKGKKTKETKWNAKTTVKINKNESLS